MWTGDRLNDAILSGMAGAVALTAVHQAAQALTDAAPRMDVLGMRALARGARAAGAQAPPDDELSAGQHPLLYGATLAGDLVSNSAYYALATTWTRGAALGLLAGIGALVLPRRLGLGEPPRSHLLANRIMTVAWYTVGGLAAAWASQLRKRRTTNSEGRTKSKA